jgi:hypothetical protein
VATLAAAAHYGWEVRLHATGLRMDLGTGARVPATGRQHLRITWSELSAALRSPSSSAWTCRASGADEVEDALLLEGHLAWRWPLPRSQMPPFPVPVRPVQFGLTAAGYHLVAATLATLIVTSSDRSGPALSRRCFTHKASPCFGPSPVRHLHPG